MAKKKQKHFIEGPAYKLGDYVDCDAIIPVAFCTRPTQDNLKQNCLKPLDPEFPKYRKNKHIIVAGRDFGRGSANENAVRSLMFNNVQAVLAESISRIFRRNSTNLGLPALICSYISDSVRPGDIISIDMDTWLVTNENSNEILPLRPISEIEKNILLAGGLINYINNKVLEPA